MHLLKRLRSIYPFRRRQGESAKVVQPYDAVGMFDHYPVIRPSLALRIRWLFLGPRRLKTLALPPDYHSLNLDKPDQKP